MAMTYYNGVVITNGINDTESTLYTTKSGTYIDNKNAELESRIQNMTNAPKPSVNSIELTGEQDSFSLQIFQKISQEDFKNLEVKNPYTLYVIVRGNGGNDKPDIPNIDPETLSRAFRVVNATKGETMQLVVSKVGYPKCALCYTDNDGASWNEMVFDEKGNCLIETNNRCVYIMGDYYGRSEDDFITISANVPHYVEGNILALTYGDKFESNNELPSTYCYYRLFAGDGNLMNAGRLVLPSTVLTENCYNEMFYMCRNLVTAPELPALTLKASCYYEMFAGCENLAYIKCDATSINAKDATYDWVLRVDSEGGEFVIPSSMETYWDSMTRNGEGDFIYDGKPRNFAYVYSDMVSSPAGEEDNTASAEAEAIVVPDENDYDSGEPTGGE